MIPVLLAQGILFIGRLYAQREKDRHCKSTGGKTG